MGSPCWYVRGRRAVASVTLAVVAALIGSAAEGQSRSSDSRAKRRTPAVEVFENCNDSVVMVSGPTATSERKMLEEFFQFGSPLKETNVGTGFVVHESGYIVTNAHTVERQVAPSVTLSDGKTFPAEILTVMRQHDLAMLKIEAGHPLKPVRMGYPGDVMIGETVVVIANPHGLTRTCTVGVVSALGRASHLVDVPGVRLQGLIQTDASINPGSSGGPWFNVAGEVIGLTASMRRDSENIAFAISIASLQNALPQLLDVEHRAGLLTGLELAPDGACRVTGVKPDSPAARAGLRPGDSLVQLAGRPIATGADWQLAMIGRKPQQPLTIDVARDGKTHQALLIPVPRPQPDIRAVLRQRLGLAAAPLEEAQAKAMGLRIPRGLMVLDIDTKAYEKYQHKPEKGDVLARIEGVRPRNLDHAAFLVESVQPGQVLRLVFIRRRNDNATRTDVQYAVP